MVDFDGHKFISLTMVFSLIFVLKKHVIFPKSAGVVIGWNPMTICIPLARDWPPRPMELITFVM